MPSAAAPATPAAQPAQAAAPAAAQPAYAQPAVAYAQPAYAQPASAGSVNVAGKSIPRKKLFIGIAAVVIVALLVLIGTSVAGCSKGYKTAEEAASALDAPCTKVLQAAIDGDSSLESVTRDFTNKVLDGMQPDMLQAALDAAGYSSRDEMMSQIAGGTGLSGLNGIGSGVVKVDCALTCGDALDSDDLDDVRSVCAVAGVDGTVSAGYELDCVMTMEVLKDYESLDAGTKETQTVNSGIWVVKIGDAWYYWGNY